MIKSNANPAEELSPFFEKNKEFCLEVERFINEYNGTSDGVYNAWSYFILAKITEPQEWVLDYKKATFTSGNLWLSSKKQSLSHSVVWKTKTRNHQNFKIKKKTIKYRFLMLFMNKIRPLELFDNYVLISNFKSQNISKVTTILESLFSSKEVYEISSLNNKLKIELRTEKHYFDIFKQLINSTLH